MKACEIYDRSCSVSNAPTWIKFFQEKLEVMERDGQDLVELQTYLDRPVADFSLMQQSGQLVYSFELFVLQDG